MSKLLMSPSITTYPEEWLELDRKAEPLELRLEVIRKQQYDTCKPNPNLEEIRKLRKELSKIDAKMSNILMEANPKYYTHWFS